MGGTKKSGGGGVALFTWCTQSGLDSGLRRCTRVRSGELRLAARAGNRRFWRLSALHAHTKPPYKMNSHRKTPRELNRPGRARTVERAGRVRAVARTVARPAPCAAAFSPLLSERDFEARPIFARRGGRVASVVDLVPPGPAPALRTACRVRSHCRFINRGTEFVRDSGIKWMSGSTKRQCAVPGGPGPVPIPNW